MQPIEPRAEHPQAPLPGGLIASAHADDHLPLLRRQHLERRAQLSTCGDRPLSGNLMIAARRHPRLIPGDQPRPAVRCQPQPPEPEAGPPLRWSIPSHAMSEPRAKSVSRWHSHRNRRTTTTSPGAAEPRDRPPISTTSTVRARRPGPRRRGRHRRECVRRSSGGLRGVDAELGGEGFELIEWHRVQHRSLRLGSRRRLQRCRLAVFE